MISKASSTLLHHPIIRELRARTYEERFANETRHVHNYRDGRLAMALIITHTWGGLWTRVRVIVGTPGGSAVKVIVDERGQLTTDVPFHDAELTCAVNDMRRTPKSELLARAI